MTVYPGKDLAFNFRTFTYRGGLNQQGLPFAYVTDILDPPATERNADGSLATPTRHPLLDYRFDSFEVGAKYRKNITLLKQLHITEIASAVGSARGERFSVANITAQAGRATVYMQFGKENFKKDFLSGEHPHLFRFSVTGVTQFKKGDIDLIGGYSQIGINGRGPGVPGNSKMINVASTQNIGKQMGPGKFFVREYGGCVDAQGLTKGCSKTVGVALGYHWR